MPNQEQQKRVPRRDLVHPKFVERWAREYLRRVKRDGRTKAIAWANEFLNPEDAHQLAAVVRRIKGAGGTVA
jgi:hypothetical protein